MLAGSGRIGRACQFSGGHPYVLLFDAGCPVCGGLARRLSEATGGEVELQDLHHSSAHEQVISILGPKAATKPSLVATDDYGAVTRAWQGWGMRIQLARILGPRKALAALALVQQELAARAAKAKGETSERGGLRRRSLFTGAFGGLALGATAQGSASAASGAGSASGMRSATSPELNAVLASRDVGVAAGAFGPVIESGAQLLDAEGERVVLLSHRGSDVIPVADPADGGALSLLTDQKANRLRIFAPDGTELFYFDTSHEGAMTPFLADGTSPTAADPQRVGLIYALCILTCLLADGVDQGCANTCFTCTVEGSFFSCLACAACAGPKINKCRKQCK
jgi:predicted DCC family thiol-disulfide oxidoreductase YuxK